MDDATSLVSTVESQTLSAEVEKDGVFSAGRQTPTTPELHKHNTGSSSGYSYYSASSGEQIGLQNFPMPTSSLVMPSKDTHVSDVSQSKPEQVTILHSTGTREHEVTICGMKDMLIYTFYALLAMHNIQSMSLLNE